MQRKSQERKGNPHDHSSEKYICTKHQSEFGENSSKTTKSDFFSERNGTVNYVISECSQLAKRE